MTEDPCANDRSPGALADRIEELTGWRSRRAVRIVDDTTEVMDLHRGHVLDLGGRLLAVLGCTYETRFGISDQPKYWVLRCVDLADGADMIVKTVFHEDFVARIGPLKIHCYRSPAKESAVLDLVRGDSRFMQGYTVRDSAGNQVRIIDHIPGPSLFNLILEHREPHEEYSFTVMPQLLRQLLPCLEGIQILHDHDLCHGDIRNDHLIRDSSTDRFRWIDFDLKQDFSDFDVWSAGNVIAYVVGQGIRSFHQVLRDPTFSAHARESLTPADGSAFYEYRVYNLRKLYPYLPRDLNDILRRFTIGAEVYYPALRELINDLGNALAKMP